MSDMTEKILLLLHINAADKKTFCLQLGRDWEEIRETLGLLRMCGWVELVPFSMEDKSISVENRKYRLSCEGMAEYTKRAGIVKEKHICTYTCIGGGNYNYACRCGKLYKEIKL
jgi:hypothetical protein